MKNIKYLIIGLLVYWIIGLSSPPPVFAQTTSTPWLFGGDFDAAVQEGIAGGNNAESWVTANLTNFFPNSLSLSLVGISSNTIEQIMSGEPLNMEFYQQMQQRSVLGGVSRGIAMIYSNPPADFGYWLADVGQTLGFIPKQAYAQGIGFSGLSALLPVWKAFRNIAYLILAIVMIVIGFMVMLRKKIDPKTVVTVQNALPRIVITLILITFSYAIVGFLIDLMYLLILLVVYAVGNAIPGADVLELQAAFTAGGALEMRRIFGSLSPIAIPGLIGVVGSIIAIIFGQPFVAALVILFGGLVATPATGDIALAGAAPILLLLLALGLIVTLVRILFMLVNAYIQIIIALIFGPLQIMLDAVPGGNGFTSWLNSLIVNLLTFPIVISLIVLGMSIGGNINGPFWSPPLVPKAPDASQFIAALIGVGIVMTIPSIVHAVKEALKIKPLVPVGAGVLTQPVTGAVGGVLQIGSQFFYTSQILGMAKGLLKREQK